VKRLEIFIILKKYSLSGLMAPIHLFLLCKKRTFLILVSD